MNSSYVAPQTGELTIHRLDEGRLVLEQSAWPQCVEIADELLEHADQEAVDTSRAGYVTFNVSNGRATYRQTTLRETLASHTYELVEGYLASN